MIQVFEKSSEHLILLLLPGVQLLCNRQLHDAFGTVEWSGNLQNVMKELIAIRERQRDLR